MGNSVPIASGKSGVTPKRQRERLVRLAKKYGLNLRLPKVGPFAKHAIVKVGAVCCDCEEQTGFCQAVLGSAVSRQVAAKGKVGVVLVSVGEQRLIHQSSMLTPKTMVAAILGSLGYSSTGREDEL